MHEIKSNCQDTEIKFSKNKLFYKCNDKSYNNNFIDCCKLINEIKLTTGEGGGVNEAERI
jgi:hypothetical protein